MKRSYQRKAVVFAVIAMALLVAGCTGNSGTGPGSAQQEQTATPTATPTPTPTPEQTEVNGVPSGEKCPVCNMMPAKYEDWNGKITFEGGGAVYLDSPKHIWAFKMKPSKYSEDKGKGDIDTVYFTEYKTGELVELSNDLYFINGSDVMGPMGPDLVPIKGKSEADAYVEEHGGEILAPEDVTMNVVMGLMSGMDMDHDSMDMNGSMDMDHDHMDMGGAKNVSEDSNCPVCDMMPAKYEDWNGQVIFKDGETAFFDAPKHVWKFKMDPGKYSNRTAEEIKAVYFTDYETKDFVKLSDNLYFINGSDIDGPMGPDLVPIQGKENAGNFVDEHGGKVLASDEVTMEIVMSLSMDMDMDDMDGSMDMN